MPKNIRVSATLSGSHPLGPGGVRGACGSIERALLDGTTEYAVQSLVPGSAFTRHGGRGGSGLLAVRVDGSSFMAVWDDESSFEAPSTFGAVGKHLEVTGEVDVRVNALVDNVAMDSPKIENGSLRARFDTAMFELDLPARYAESAPEDEITFVGLTSRVEDATVKLAIFGASKPKMPSVPITLERALGALSSYCGDLIG